MSDTRYFMVCKGYDDGYITYYSQEDKALAIFAMKTWNALEREKGSSIRFYLKKG